MLRAAVRRTVTELRERWPRGLLGVQLTLGASVPSPGPGWTIRVSGTGNEADAGRSMWSVWNDPEGRIWIERFGAHVGVLVLVPVDAADSMVRSYLVRRAAERRAS